MEEEVLGAYSIFVCKYLTVLYQGVNSHSACLYLGINSGDAFECK